MTIKNTSVRVHKYRRFTPGPKYNLIEREKTPAQERAEFREQDERFCAAMRSAIAAGLERP